MTVAATVVDSDGVALAGKDVTLAIGGVSATVKTGANGVATTSLTLDGPARSTTLTASFGGDGDYGSSSDSEAFTIAKEDTVITLGAQVTSKGRTTMDVKLAEGDGPGLAGRTVELFAEVKQKGQLVFVSIGSVQTGPGGTATASIPTANKGARIRATYAGDGSFLGASATR